MKNCEKLKSWKIRLGLPVLDFKISWECFELNQRRENITKWTTPPPLCVVPIDRKETLHHYQKIVPFEEESDDIKERLYQEALGQRSNRLKVAVSCHSCRQKNYCDEEDCKRCGDLNMDQPCLGMSDCSICHSSNGLLCRECLKNRYGEELEEVRANKEWICPHCTEEKGIKPYWFCNRSLCLKK